MTAVVLYLCFALSIIGAVALALHLWRSPVHEGPRRVFVLVVQVGLLPIVVISGSGAFSLTVRHFVLRELVTPQSAAILVWVGIAAVVAGVYVCVSSVLGRDSDGTAAEE